MAKEFRKGQRVILANNLYRCSGCGGNHGKYFYEEKLDQIPLKSQGKIIGVESADKLLLRLKDGREFYFHPNELELSFGTLDLGVRVKLGRLEHPVFEMSKETALFFIKDKAYSLGEGEVDGQFFESQRLLLKSRKPIVEISDIASLDDLALQRNEQEIERIKDDYAAEVMKRLNLDGKFSNSNLDVAQLIVSQVFPYLRSERVQRKINGLLGVDEEVRKRREITNDRYLERIVDEVETELIGFAAEIEDEELEEDVKDKKERGKKESKLDKLLFEGDEFQKRDGTPLMRAVGRDFALIDGELYYLNSADKKSEKSVTFSGRRYALDRTDIKDRLAENYATLLSKQVRVDALKTRLSRENILKELKEKANGLDSVLGLNEYSEEDFGFIKHQNEYYVFLQVPQMAIKSKDGNYYFYDKTRVAIKVYKIDSGRLSYGNGNAFSNAFVIENNDHPFVHMAGNFSAICLGDGQMPSDGRDVGEVIAKRLKRAKEVMMYGTASDFFDPLSEPSEWIQKSGKNRESHIRPLSELKEQGVFVIQAKYAGRIE